MDLFKEWLPSIMQTKVSVIKDEIDEKEYDAYMINKALALHRDCLFYADQMNRLADLPNAAQYDYLMGSIRKARRPFVPWPKKISEASLKLVQRHFGYSHQKALVALKILTDDQLAELQALYKDIKI